MSVDFAIIGAIISLVFEQVPILKNLLAQIESAGYKRIFLGVLIAVVAFGSNWLAWQSIGSNEPLEWGYFWQSVMDWFFGYVSSQFTHVLVNKK